MNNESGPEEVKGNTGEDNETKPVVAAAPPVSDPILEPAREVPRQTVRHVVGLWQIAKIIAAVAVLLWIFARFGLLPNQQMPIPQRPVPPPLPPVRAGEILPQFKVITVAREYAQPVKTRFYTPMPELNRKGLIGRTAERLFHGEVPGTSEYLIYDMITTVTAGVDLSKLQEGDIVNDDKHTTITLPEPEILTVSIDQHRSQILWHDKPFFPVADESARIMIQTQKRGEAEVRREATHDERLMLSARQNAESSLRQFLQAMHPGRSIHFNYKRAPTTSTALIKPGV